VELDQGCAEHRRIGEGLLNSWAQNGSRQPSRAISRRFPEPHQGACMDDNLLAKGGCHFGGLAISPNDETHGFASRPRDRFAVSMA
jgi:hypothetical protein